MALSLKGGVSLFNGTAGEIEIDGQNVIALMPMPAAKIAKSYNTTYDTSVSDDFITVQSAASPADFELVGYLVRVAIHNRSGASDTYDFTLDNFTTSTGLVSWSAITIPNRAIQEYLFVAGIDKINKGDYLKLNISDGVLGTGAGEIANGSIEMELTALVKMKPLADFQGIYQVS